MKKPVFTGAGVAIITPMYEDGSINFDELGRIIEDQIARHTDAIIICGPTASAARAHSFPPRRRCRESRCPRSQASGQRSCLHRK